MLWTECPWLGFDTETTGVNVSKDRLVTAATVLRIGGNGGVSGDEAAAAGGGSSPSASGVTDHVYTWLADPGVPIPAGATAVHGISTAYAQANGRPIREVLDEVGATLADHWRRGFPVVAFNAPYDITLLEAELERHALPSLSERCDGAPMLVLDPLVLDRHFVPRRRGKRTLGDLAPAYGVALSENAHTADADVLMTLDILAAMTREFSDLSGASLHDLMDAQRLWHAQWAEDFESFLQSKGRMDSISRIWL